MLPEPYRERLADIFREVEKKERKNPGFLRQLDKLEALIQHNEAVFIYLAAAGV